MAEEDACAMAYGRPDGPHAFVRLEKDLKEGNIPSLVLLCGQEAYLTDHYAQTVVNRFTEPASRQMDLAVIPREKLTNEEIRMAAETLPLMSARKVIQISGFINQNGKYPKADEQEKEDIDGFLAFLKEIPEGVLVLLTADAPLTTGDYNKQSDGRKLKKLQTAVKKAGGTTYDFTPLDRATLRSFVAKRFQQAGKTCTRDALQTILNDSGYENRYVDYDLYALENDLKKIIAHSGDSPLVTAEDLEGTLSVNPENNVFAMLDAIGRGRKDQALLHLNTLLEEGESEFGILSGIVRQLELMLAARELQEEGRTVAQSAAYLEKEEKTARFRAKKAAETAARIPAVQLRRMLKDAFAVEDHIKSGLMESRLALEYFISEA